MKFAFDAPCPPVLVDKTPRLRSVRLYGELGRLFGREHRLAVRSAAEAVAALGAQLKGFEQFLYASKDKGLAYAVFYGKKNLNEKELREPAGTEDIRIAPIVMGAKRGGFFQVVLGVVLVVVGVVFSEFLGPAAPYVINMGIGLIVGGVVQLLSPQPKGKASDDRPENKPSYTFNGPINTQAQGHPVQVLYGRLIVGSAVLSAGIDVKNDAYVPRGGGGINGYGGGGGMGAQEYYDNVRAAFFHTA